MGYEPVQGKWHRRTQRNGTDEHIPNNSDKKNPKKTNQGKREEDGKDCTQRGADVTGNVRCEEEEEHSQV